MPNKKISELTTVASPLSADYIPVVEAGVGVYWIAIGY
jgi:hypothetical protein